MKKITKVTLAAAAFAAVFGFASCSKSSGNSSERVLNLYNWTYYTPDDVIAAFEKEFNCKVNVDSYASNEEMYTKIVGGAKGYDIVVPSQDYVSIMIEQGMLQKLDHSKLTNAGNINPAVLEKATYDPTMEYAVPYYLGAAGISVNKTKINTTDYARDWGIFADKRFAGHASMMDDMREVMGDALVHLGYSVNSTDEAELDAATKLINEQWKPNLAKFDAEGFGKSFSQGDFWLCQGYAEVIFGEIEESKWDNVDFFIPEEGGPCYLDSMCILKGAKHFDLAMEFINFIHRPENYAKFLDFFHFPCYVNLPAAEFTTETPMYQAEMMDNCVLKNDVGEDLLKFVDRWETIRIQ